MSILDTVELSLANFRPKTHRQFVAFAIADRFGDSKNLARYLNVCALHPKNVLLEAARLSEGEAHKDGSSPVVAFFRLLEKWGDKEDA